MLPSSPTIGHSRDANPQAPRRCSSIKANVMCFWFWHFAIIIYVFVCCIYCWCRLFFLNMYLRLLCLLLIRMNSRAPRRCSSVAARGYLIRAAHVLFCESDTRCTVLQYRILLDRKVKWANESLKGHPLRWSRSINQCTSPRCVVDRRPHD